MKTKAIKKQLDRAVAITGSQKDLAKAIGASQGAVTNWVLLKHPVPLKYLSAIEKATGGLVTAAHLRPDLAKVFAK
jgi:DNA-binding transcriptional regulator YdaS (Cro superfamily)